MDTYDPDTVFSSIDHQGRYRYSNQPPIAHWNLTRLAETLLPLFSDDQDEAVDMAKEELNAFASQFETCYTRRMCQKLGLFTPQDGEVPASDQLLAVDLLQLMLNHEADYTNTFVRLTLAVQFFHKIIESVFAHDYVHRILSKCSGKEKCQNRS